MSRHRLLIGFVAIFVGWVPLRLDQPKTCFAQNTRSEASVVNFDVPAILSVREIVHEPADALSLAHPHTSKQSQKTIEVIVPVTSEIRSEDQIQISSSRFDVYWNRNPFPICDYGPKTQTFSEIEGTMAVEKSNENNSAIGLNLSGGYQNFINGTSKAERGAHEAAQVHYQEIPQHDVLIAAGTIHRGTGAFFRFHPSRLETLEGGRDLVLSFQVPKSWRGGVLQVECTATGNQQMFAWKEPFEIRRSFVVPVYLDSDDQARASAMDFVRREQTLRSRWQQHQKQQARSNMIGSKTNVATASFFNNAFNGAFNGTTGNRSTAPLPADWIHYLIQNNDAPLEKYRAQLPEDLAAAANDFVQSRSELLEFSR